MPLSVLEPHVALVVVDLQHGVVGFSTIHPAAEVVMQAAALARAFREASQWSWSM